MNARILVVDDEPDIRLLLKDILEDEGYQVDVAEHARAANKIRSVAKPDLVLLDIWMPEVDGVTLLKEWKTNRNDSCPVVMMSGHGTVETAVEATRYGAFDFVEKPLSMAKLLSTVKSALSSVDSGQDSEPLEEPVGNSQQVQELRKQMQLLRNSNQPVFIVGADGSGRKIWANYLIRLSNPDTSLKVFDPAMDLMQFMPLSSNLYFEEISGLNELQQTQFLQLIHQQNTASDLRVIACSHFSWLQLSEMAGVLPRIAELWKTAIEVPTLRDHIEDIPELLEYYVNWFGENEQLSYRHFGVAAQNLLRNHDWAGDLTQLKKFVRTTLNNSQEHVVELDEINHLLQNADFSSSLDPENTLQLSIDLNLDLREAREIFEREYLSRHLQLCEHNITALAKRVGQERTHLYRKLKSLGLYTKKHS
ncbi:MAG: sigma-54-dependent Fis family transcriptional regulator [Gammaproteobacteria bacterium]|nr:sigma-54-dependent Fis family transcriptional regulator [Gammaproteobacteria bacterium]